MIRWRIDYFHDKFREKHVAEYPEVNGRRMQGMRHVLTDYNKPPVIIVDQDECIFKSGDMERRYWAEPGKVPSMAKTEGSGFMVSGYGMWGLGFVTLTAEEKEACNIDLKHWTWSEDDKLWYSYHIFEYGKNREGYWNGEKMAKQSAEVEGVLGWMFPGHTHGRVVIRLVHLP